MLEADPLADIANLKRRAYVMARGRLYAEADLQQGIDALAEHYGGLVRPPRL